MAVTACCNMASGLLPVCSECSRPVHVITGRDSVIITNLAHRHRKLRKIIIQLHFYQEVVYLADFSMQNLMVRSAPLLFVCV